MQNKFIQYGAGGAALLIFFLLMLVAWRGGQSRAQAALVAHNANELDRAAIFFASDQNRYPTAFEFADPGAMGVYLTPFPPVEFTTKYCQQSFSYKNPSPSTYTLLACFPSATDAYPRGWNDVTKSSLN